MRPTRFDLMLQYAREFVTEWFDQNPLGQIGVVGMRAGVGERIGALTGNPQEVLKSIADRHKFEPMGEPSLQNSIEMARNSMRYVKYVLFSSVLNNQWQPPAYTFIPRDPYHVRILDHLRSRKYP